MKRTQHHFSDTVTKIYIYIYMHNLNLIIEKHQAKIPVGEHSTR